MSGPAPTALAVARRRAAVILGLTALVAAVTLVVHGPIPQDEGYHAFADARGRLGIPNFADVVSNAAFLAVGLAGVRALSRLRNAPTPPPRWTSIGFALFVLGIASTAVGSTIYHLHPTDATLVYDRVPMALGFGAFSALVLGERLGARVGRAMLWPAAALGVAGVLVWAATLDGRGGDDLRLYAFVQYFAVLAVAALPFLVPEPRATRRPLLFAAGAYVLAKLFEHFDGVVLRATGDLVSGHTLKHLVAATAGWYLVRWFSAAASHATWAATRSR